MISQVRFFSFSLSPFTFYFLLIRRFSA